MSMLPWRNKVPLLRVRRSGAKLIKRANKVKIYSRQRRVPEHLRSTKFIFHSRVQREVWGEATPFDMQNLIKSGWAGRYFLL